MVRQAPSRLSALAVIASMVMLSMTMVSVSVLGQADTLWQGNVLRPSGSLVSNNGNFRLVLAVNDGNMKVINTQTTATVWQNNVIYTGPHKLIMQSDCNLIQYTDVAGSTDRVLASSMSWQSGYSNCRLALLDDGNLQIRGWNGYNHEGVKWQSSNGMKLFYPDRLLWGDVLRPGMAIDSPNLLYRATLNGNDGNFAVYTMSGGQITGVKWATNMLTTPAVAAEGLSLQVQSNCNVVVSSLLTNTTVWQTHTDGDGRATWCWMALLDDGTLSLNHGSEHIWSSFFAPKVTSDEGQLWSGQEMWEGQRIKETNAPGTCGETFYETYFSMNPDAGGNSAVKAFPGTLVLRKNQNSRCPPYGSTYSYVWVSDTNNNAAHNPFTSKYKLVMRPDCDLAWYNRETGALLGRTDTAGEGLLCHLTFGDTDVANGQPSISIVASDGRTILRSCDFPGRERASPTTLFLNPTSRLFGSSLKKGETLGHLSYLLSPSGQWKAKLLANGNFVLFDTWKGTIVWMNGVAQSVQSYYNAYGSTVVAYNMKLESDCRLVERDWQNRILATTTNAASPTTTNCQMKMQDDGNLVIYTYQTQDMSDTPVAVWARMTAYMPPTSS